MRSFLLIALLSLSAFFTFSQTSETESTELPKRLSLPRFERSINASYELGTGGFFFKDTLGYPYDWGVPDNLEMNKKATTNSFSLYYEQQVNWKGWGHSIGLGVNVLQTENILDYRSPIVFLIEPNGDQLVLNYFDVKTYKMHLHIAVWSLDLPLSLSYAFRLRDRSFVRPYVGVKMRNLIYFVDETKEDTYLRVGIHPENGNSIGSANVRYGTTYPQRFILFGFAGVKGTTLLKNGAAINYFADYNLAFFNRIEVYLSDFKSTEVVTAYNTDTGEKTKVSYNFSMYGAEGQRVPMALRMSTVRIGVSYSLPSRK